MDANEFETNFHPAGAKVELQVHLDEDTLNVMRREAEVMGDANLQMAIERRFKNGVPITLFYIKEPQWRPRHRQTTLVKFSVRDHCLGQLNAISDKYGFDLDAVVSTILYNDVFIPTEVINTSPPEPWPLRHQRGRGSIYSIPFDIAGYQLAFLYKLCPRAFDHSKMVEQAILTLARHILHVEQVGGFPVTDEARAHARSMLSFWPRA